MLHAPGSIIPRRKERCLLIPGHAPLGLGVYEGIQSKGIRFLVSIRLLTLVGRPVNRRQTDWLWQPRLHKEAAA